MFPKLSMVFRVTPMVFDIYLLKYKFSYDGLGYAGVYFHSKIRIL